MNNSRVLVITSSVYSCMVSAWETLTVTTSLLVLTLLATLTCFWITKYWPLSFERMRDETCPLPLPPGTMGYPFIGETLEFIKKGRRVLRLASQPLRPGVQDSPAGHAHGARGGWPAREARAARRTHQCQVHVARQRAASDGPSRLAQSAGGWTPCHQEGHQLRLRPDGAHPFVPKIQAVMDRHLDAWCRRSEAEGRILGYPACQEVALDLSLEVTLGVNANDTQRDAIRSAIKVFVTNAFSMPWAIPGSGLWKGLRARRQILAEVRKKLEKGPTRGDADFLSQAELLQQCPEFRDHQGLLEDNCLEMVFAAYATTSSALCNTLLCLGRNPEVLQKVEAELKREGLLDDPSVALTYEVIGRLQYVHNVNREVMRMFPPAGAGFRKVIKTLSIGGCQIPKDWTVAYSIRETQQISEAFPEPERFFPDRWLALDSEEMKEKIRFEYIPFGVGARACVGRRLALLYQAVFLVEVVRRCHFQLRNPTPVIKHIPTVKPADDLPATFRRRGTASHSSKSKC